MANDVIHEMTPRDQYYVGTCTHVRETAEIDACSKRRIEWMSRMIASGLRVTVAEVDGEPRGFLFLFPVEICPWGPIGSDVSVIPCLCVEKPFQGRGRGKALIDDATQWSKKEGFKGTAVQAYSHDFWFMQDRIFLRNGFDPLERRGDLVLLWKAFSHDAAPPRLLQPRFEFQPIPRNVVVDLFWNQFCQTSDIEAERVREVAAEYGNLVILHEHQAEDREELMRHEIPRGIYVNGREFYWGYEAPREGIRDAIREALKNAKQG
jgi:GNAT superfamily N-acetyltransferase